MRDYEISHIVGFGDDFKGFFVVILVIFRHSIKREGEVCN
jgi:hypothetical protein